MRAIVVLISKKSKRELSEAEIEQFCDRLYLHAKELCCTEDNQKALKKIGKNQLLTYKLIVEDNGKYYATHGYQLIDGQVEEYPGASIQCAVFKGNVRNIFITRKEFTGSIDEQIESAYSFVLEHIIWARGLMDSPGRIFMNFQFERSEK